MIKPRIAKREVTLHILRAFGLHISKRLGQNFLVDEAAVDAIVAAAGVKAGDAVLEIGPGIGTLTQGLLEAGAKVVAVELDQRLVGVLRETLAGYDDVRVIHGDILKVDIPREMATAPYK
ncbi:MAG TPA: rRNA adenine N-6-methyltransferase family protein, partial [Negativicutes bacterium]|nr:rRNA adenine N-6-methyltransferase family protein [Negativicutes bacterium]